MNTEDPNLKHLTDSIAAAVIQGHVTTVEVHAAVRDALQTVREYAERNPDWRETQPYERVARREAMEKAVAMQPIIDVMEKYLEAYGEPSGIGLMMDFRGTPQPMPPDAAPGKVYRTCEHGVILGSWCIRCDRENCGHEDVDSTNRCRQCGDQLCAPPSPS